MDDEIEQDEDEADEDEEEEDEESEDLQEDQAGKFSFFEIFTPFSLYLLTNLENNLKGHQSW